MENDNLDFYKNLFCKNFNELIAVNHYSHQYIADKTGFSIASVSNWRNGKREPKISEVCILADFFDVPLDVLTGRKEY